SGLCRIMVQRFENVSIRLRVAVKEFPEQRHHQAQISKIESAPNRIRRLSKIKDQKAAAGSGPPQHLFKPTFPTAQIPKAISDRDDVAVFLGKWRGQRIATDKLWIDDT